MQLASMILIVLIYSFHFILFCSHFSTFFRDAMQIAARNGSVPMLDLIKQWGGSLTTVGPKGDTLFHLTAYNGHIKAMKWLYENGAISNAIDNFGQTAIHVAAKRCEPEILIYLYDEMNSDFTQLDFDGMSPYDCVPRYGEDDERKSKLDQCRKIISTANNEINKIKKTKNDAKNLINAKKVSNDDEKNDNDYIIEINENDT